MRHNAPEYTNLVEIAQKALARRGTAESRNGSRIAASVPKRVGMRKAEFGGGYCERNINKQMTTITARAHLHHQASGLYKINDQDVKSPEKKKGGGTISASLPGRAAAFTPKCLAICDLRSILPFHTTNSPAFGLHADPRPNTTVPHFEFIFIPGDQIAADGNLPSAPDDASHFMAIGISLRAPISRGSVNISSSDPFAHPLIDSGLFQEEFGVLALRDAATMALNFVQQPAWEGYIDQIVTQGLDSTSIETNISDQSFYFSGTNGISAKGTSYGVVDPDFLVKGTSGLSVIDASALPLITKDGC
ncbi:hypothetical protein B0H17DRAFT_1146968 [Mycena rosella]|uniref:Glucose-methanol-choline oxidoreductase C-terminal domain-containing protein n=1 Tax=Mycena rosella TaxID=1033263 RepID=A0AAD7CMN5_MYCRO|nr:hypothetical protein B0H17DRAFT_1146968 [Mycena rosella]